MLQADTPALLELIRPFNEHEAIRWDRELLEARRCWVRPRCGPARTRCGPVVRPENEVARRLYAEAGFEPVPRIMLTKPLR